MSQMYRIALKSSVKRTITASDSITYPIQLTEILPEDEMKDVLKERLRAHGFEEQEDGTFRKPGEAGETITVDLEKMEAEASLSAERDMETEVEATGSGGTRTFAQTEAQRVLAAKEQHAREMLGSKEKGLQEDLTGRLEESEEGRMRDFNEILQETYAESLKRKARQMGEVMEVREGTTEDGQYELTIRVEN
ncbi:MAG: hypothetical protein RLY93_06980 [Sumerlaeia bacterium]